MQFTDLCLWLAPRLSPNSSEFFRGHAPCSCLCESHSKIAAGCSMLKYLFRGLLNVRYLKVATMCSPFYPFPDRFTKDRRHRRAQQTGLDRLPLVWPQIKIMIGCAPSTRVGSYRFLEQSQRLHSLFCPQLNSFLPLHR